MILIILLSRLDILTFFGYFGFMDFDFEMFYLTLQALVHYKPLHNHEIVKKFFSPTDDDFNTQQRM